MIKSINTDNNQIILDILELHVPSKKIDVDLTYSSGNFYKDGRIKPPALKFDLFPQTPDTIQANSEYVPLLDGSVDSILYDPPFLPGASDKKTGIIAKRFGWFKTVKDLWASYDKTIQECSRILKSKGILIIKCQDVCNCGKNHASHYEVMKYGEKHGLIFKDLAILLAKHRLTDKRWKTQKHFRKFHCFFVILQKP